MSRSQREMAEQLERAQRLITSAQNTLDSLKTRLDGPSYPIGTVAHITLKDGRRAVAELVKQTPDARGMMQDRPGWKVGLNVWDYAKPEDVIKVEPVQTVITSEMLNQMTTGYLNHSGTSEIYRADVRDEIRAGLMRAGLEIRDETGS